MQEQFRNYQKALQTTGRSIPRLLIDLDLLDQNIAALQQMTPEGMELRLVVKSLPSTGLIEYLQEKLNTNRLMVFHQPFLSEISAHLAGTAAAKTDILLGKPMTSDTAAYYYRNVPSSESFNPFHQVQWLIDTEQRLMEYLELAMGLGCGVSSPRLRLNLEIDVGLHRGGFANLNNLRSALALLEANQDSLVFSGLMGYDPHVVKIPRILRSRQKLQRAANQFYEECKHLIRDAYPVLWHEHLCFNGAGSPTLALHQQDSPLSEVSAGSALLKPTTFDLPTLSNFEPACFISAPVLKTFPNTTIPGVEFLPNKQPSCFIYGGYWKADYHFPVGAKENKLFGASTNQSLVNVPKGTSISVGDYVFLRPQQSEFVMLQFGDILAIRGGHVEAEWPILSN